MAIQAGKTVATASIETSTQAKSHTISVGTASDDKQFASSGTSPEASEHDPLEGESFAQMMNVLRRQILAELRTSDFQKNRYFHQMQDHFAMQAGQAG